MTNYTNMTMVEARDGLLRKDFTAVELTQAHIKKMEETRDLNAFISETPEIALEMAKSSDKRIAEGKAGLMEGLPIGIKDLFCTQGTRTTAASKILEDFIPPYESTITTNLFKEGSVMLGKLNLDEFAMGSANITSAFGPVKSPWKALNDEKTYVPGGSSGGSAAAVAVGSVMAATGTDTGGSIRQPAAFTGIVGIKPTYGLCSRFGVVAFASSLDQAGPMAKTVEDAALMLEVMASYDSKDSTSLDVKIPNYLNGIQSGVKGMRVGIPKEYQVDGLNPEIQALWDQGIEWLKDMGAVVESVSLPHTKYALPTYYIIAPAEASSNLARYDGVRYGMRASEDQLNAMYEVTRANGFGDEVRRRILIGTYVLSAGYYDAYYIKAQKMKRLIVNDFKDAYQKVDMILTPTTPTAAFPLGEEPKDPVAMYMNDVLTVPANIAGLPCISVPAGLNSNGLPLGLQLVGPALSEAKLFQAAYALEQAAQFQQKVNGLRKAS